jgi:hypothetical protein
LIGKDTDYLHKDGYKKKIRQKNNTNNQKKKLDGWYAEPSAGESQAASRTEYQKIKMPVSQVPDVV